MLQFRLDMKPLLILGLVIVALFLVTLPALGISDIAASPALASSYAQEGATDAHPLGQEDGGGRDILPLAVLTVGSAAGVALFALLVTLARKRIGWEPHRPPEGSQADHLGHPEGH
ncbi:MAG TPA: hypothetical protein VNL15_01150 [Dehalococcoidia bacterium]|nr:hypothetical protein [Dehalococcoidia bacterium]